MASALKNLIPPKIASAQALSSSSTAARMQRVVEFYSKLPKGPAPKASPGLNPFARYKARYIDGENASGAPLFHAMLGLFLIGQEERVRE
ncbi:ATP synthase f chain, mitochondrial precursor [Puccinia graminis f. sp. tritici]|uniref:ATP synthase f chain, mitochondrial n=1 Tax=Puccinia graminis f. sp. tritici TaxID=56615 RepID=A0A5B0PSS5_PUCGR|nr:ATP synthase f chain, mitochondrial precursor [Puccinia graminis f. sp. tritici]